MATTEDTIEVRDGRLVIDVALTPGQLSTSGKNTVLFTTRGNKEINDGFIIGVNLYKRAR